MADDKKVDPRFSLHSYDGILHVCEDILKNYRKGILEKKDVDAIMSIVTVSRQTLSDKGRYSKKTSPAISDKDAFEGVTSNGPFNVFAGGAK